MSNVCNDPVTCKNGNCEGCKNGQPWCQDPRCQPNCASCPFPPGHDFGVNMIVVIILVCLLTILFIVWFVYGPSLFVSHSNHEAAHVVMPPETTTPQNVTAYYT